LPLHSCGWFNQSFKLLVRGSVYPVPGALIFLAMENCSPETYLADGKSLSVSRKVNPYAIKSLLLSRDNNFSKYNIFLKIARFFLHLNESI
jgi:hypothetical protein